MFDHLNLLPLSHNTISLLTDTSVLQSICHLNKNSVISNMVRQKRGCTINYNEMTASNSWLLQQNGSFESTLYVGI